MEKYGPQDNFRQAISTPENSKFSGGDSFPRSDCHGWELSRRISSGEVIFLVGVVPVEKSKWILSGQ